MHILYYTASIIFTVIYFLIMTLLFLVTAPFDRERCVLQHASRVWAMGMFGLCPTWKIKVEGLEKIDRSKAYVVATNHQAMLDIPLMYVLPMNFKWVAKKEVYKMPIFGWVMRMHDDIAIERGTAASAKKMMRKGMARLAAGTSIIIFPEGTRSRDGRVGRFREGAFSLASHGKVPVLPCAIEGTGSLRWDGTLCNRHTFHVRVLDPIPASEVAALGPKELAGLVQQRITEAHKTLRKDLY